MLGKCSTTGGTVEARVGKAMSNLELWTNSGCQIIGRAMKAIS